jgi:hypothetical protein
VNAYRDAADALVRESGVTIKRVRSSNSGGAYTRSDGWEIEAPDPRGPISFGVFAHEVGHQMLHRGARKPRWIQEVEAEEWALAQFDRFDLDGKERYRLRAARNVGWSFAKAIRRNRLLTKTIVATYPEWWVLAEAVETADGRVEVIEHLAPLVDDEEIIRALPIDARREKGGP